MKQRDALVLADMIEAADRTLQKAECGKDALMSDPDARDMREDAMRLIAELQDVEGRLKRLKVGLQRLVDEDG